MSKRKHRVRRGGIAVIPIVISMIFSLLIPVNVTAECFFCFITSDNRGLGDIVGLYYNNGFNFVNLYRK